jgi:hypothetical protein
MAEKSMRRVSSVLKGMSCITVAHLAWVALAILFGRFGLRLSSSTSDPTFRQIASQQFRDLLVPFFPAALLSGVVLGVITMRIYSSYRTAAIGAIAAPISFVISLLLVTAVVNAASSHAIGYAAEQGMSVLGYVIIAPFLGLTASPLWAIAAGLLVRSVNNRSKKESI